MVEKVHEKYRKANSIGIPKEEMLMYWWKIGDSFKPDMAWEIDLEVYNEFDSSKKDCLRKVYFLKLDLIPGDVKYYLHKYLKIKLRFNST